MNKEEEEDKGTNKWGRSWFNDFENDFESFMSGDDTWSHNVIDWSGKDILLTVDITVKESVFGVSKGVIYS